LLYTVTDQDIAFHVPDSCWTTVRNGNSLGADFREDIIKTWLERGLFLLFIANLVVVLGLLNIAG